MWLRLGLAVVPNVLSRLHSSRDDCLDVHDEFSTSRVSLLFRCDIARCYDLLFYYG